MLLYSLARQPLAGKARGWHVRLAAVLLQSSVIVSQVCASIQGHSGYVDFEHYSSSSMHIQVGLE